jgi:hypothetical protein
MPCPFYPKRDLAAQSDFYTKELSDALREAKPAAARRGWLCASCSLMKRGLTTWIALPVLGADRHTAGSPPNSSANTSICTAQVSPKDGIRIYLIMCQPRIRHASRSFLEALARKFAQQDILLILHCARNHRCRDLAVPANITVLHLPPYLQELNQKENLWEENRDKNLRELRAQIHGRSACQAQAGHLLYRAQSKARPLHHLVPLHRQITLVESVMRSRIDPYDVASRGGIRGGRH